MKSSPSPQVIAWISGQTAGSLFTTTITIAEVLFGAEILPKGKRRDLLLQQAEATFAQDFADQVLSFDEASARLFAAITASRRSQGRPMGTFDAQIAAIARANGAMLATRDTADFEGCGVYLINLWNEGS